MSGRKVLLLVAAVAALGLPSAASACLPPPPPTPPPQTADESDAAFAARRSAWYAEKQWRQTAEFKQELAERQAALWDEAARIVVVRIERVGSTWVPSRGGGPRYRSPLVTVRAVRWVKGTGMRSRADFHAASGISCDDGGVGEVLQGKPGELFVVFLRPGPLTSRSVIDSFRQDRAMTKPTRAAFEAEAAS